MAFRKLVAAAVLSLPLAGLAQTPPAPQPNPPSAPAPAPAATPPIQLYGTLNVNLQYTQAKGATVSTANVQPRFAIATDSTNLGVRGSLDLTHGYKGVYQCETQANLDGEDTRALCNRNSRVGIGSFWGTLWYGNWDTPFKAGHYGTKADDPFGNTDVFGFNSLMGSPGYGIRSSAFNSSAAAATSASFDQRAANSVGYWSPKFGPGISFKLQYSVDELASANGVVRPQLFSGVFNFDRGPFSLVAASEYHEDAFGISVVNPANTGKQPSKDLAWRLAAGYDIPLGVGTLNVMGMVDQLMYAQSDTTAGYKDYTRLAWLLGAKFRIEDHEFRARYSQALNPSITAANGTTLAPGAEDNLGAQEYTLGYAFYFNKNTQLYAFYTQIMNERAARYTYPVGGAAAVAGGIPAGSDPTTFGAGIRLAVP